MDESKAVGIFAKLDGASINRVIFENLNITLGVNSGINVTVGALAAEANNTTLKDVSFDGLTINTGKGDDGKADYIVSDLFAKYKNSNLENVTGTKVEITASEFAEVRSLLKIEDQPVEPPIDNPETPAE